MFYDAHFTIDVTNWSRGSDKYSVTWEHARSDARDRLADLCDLVGVPAEQVIGFDI